MNLKQFRLPVGVFLTVVFLLSFVQWKVENPLLLLERFIEGGGWFEIIANVGLMSAVFGTPFYLISGGLAALFSYFILRK